MFTVTSQSTADSSAILLLTLQSELAMLWFMFISWLFS